jgi:hypothetical protein
VLTENSRQNELMEKKWKHMLPKWMQYAIKGATAGFVLTLQ